MEVKLHHILQLQDGSCDLSRVGSPLKMTPPSGRPLSAFSEDDVTAVKRLLDEDARYTVDEISESLSINSSAVFMILKQRLGLRKICAC